MKTLLGASVLVQIKNNQRTNDGFVVFSEKYQQRTNVRFVHEYHYVEKDENYER